MKLENKIIEDFAEHLKQVMDNKKIHYSSNASNEKIVVEYLNACEKWVTKQKRRVYFSNELDKKMQEKKYYDQGNHVRVETAEEVNGLIEHFKILFQQGEDINNHLSRQIYTSDRQDMLLNTWNVKHIHLNKKEVTSKSAMKKNRADWLLFCIIEEKNVYFIDVLAHPEKEEFSSYALLKIIFANNWMSKIGFKEIDDNYIPYSIEPRITDDKTLYELYSANINVCFDFEGHGYVNLGITTVGNKISHTHYLNELLKGIRKFPYKFEEYIGFEPVSMESGNGILRFMQNGKKSEIGLRIDDYSN